MCVFFTSTFAAFSCVKQAHGRTKAHQNAITDAFLNDTLKKSINTYIIYPFNLECKIIGRDPMAKKQQTKHMARRGVHWPN